MIPEEFSAAPSPIVNTPEVTPTVVPAWTTDEQEEIREYTFSEREPRLVSLEGQGWTLQEGRGSYKLIQRILEDGATHFSLLFSGPGEVELIFHRQDLGRRILYRKTVHLNIQESPSVVENPRSPEVETAPSTETTAMTGDIESDEEIT